MAPMALAFWPGWMAGAYSYHNGDYHRNATSNSTNGHHHFRDVGSADDQNQTVPVTCLCLKDADCGCDKNNDSSYLAFYTDKGADGLPRNSSQLRVARVNETQGIFVNGTVPKGGEKTSKADGSWQHEVRYSVMLWCLTSVIATAFFFL